MGRRTFIGGGRGIVLEDVGGSFARFLKETPRIARAYLADAVEKTAFSMANRMRHLAPEGPDAPHVKQAITYKRRGQAAMVGFIEATEPAAPGSEASIADVAVFNEYRPNAQPFMRPAAEDEDADFRKRVTQALQRMDRDLSGGAGTV